jgi:hypothetical protein
MSTSFLEVIAADQSNQRLADRQAAVAAKHRVASTLGRFITESSSKDEVCARLSLVDDEILTIVSRACEEYGSDAHEAINEAIRLTAVSRFNTNTKTASVHESRRPKMCPFHKDVVDISLTSEDPRAGFDSMAQHWGGPRHCEGDGYEGNKCNFKPQMATQSYWNEKAEKAEERKRDRAEQVELEQSQDFVTEDVEAEEFDTTLEDFDDQVEQDMDSLTDDGISDNVVEVDFGGGDESVVEEPMEVAASTKVADEGNTDLGEPLPKMDKSKWTPKNVTEIKTDDENGPHPTKHKDIIGADLPNNGGDRFNPGALSEIGENVTERQDVTKDTNPSDQGAHTKTWSGGGQSAVTSAKADDVYKNPLKELLESDYDGFIPQEVVQSAIASYKQ